MFENEQRRLIVTEFKRPSVIGETSPIVLMRFKTGEQKAQAWAIG